MKQTKKILILLSVLVLTFSLAVPVVGAEVAVTVTLRIEGAEKTLFYDTIEMPYQADLTVWDVIAYADSKDNTLTVDAPAGAYGIYINGINGETAGQVAPLRYDGWSYQVNGEDGTVGVDACPVANGDSIVVYYSDAWGTEGFQAVDDGFDKEINQGVLTFTSTVFDWNTNQDVTTPIAGATVTWGYGENQTATYTTDESGVVRIDAAQLTPGEHTVQIEKYSETTVTAGGKLPLVLRLAPDTVVLIEASEEEESASKQEIASKTETKEDLKSPKTGEPATCMVLMLVAVSMGCLLVTCRKKKVR